MAAAIFLGFNILAFVALLRWGDRPERITVAMTIVYIAVSMVAGPLDIGDWRFGIALIDLMYLIGLVVLTERRGRWWLVLATSAQLGVIITHILPLIAPGDSVMASYALRMGFWIVISIAFFVGAWEAWADRRYRLEETHSHGQSRHHPS
ncbi:hypothetical protein BH09PSE1_BH09PSE1_19400 [soil metagenome]